MDWSKIFGESINRRLIDESGKIQLPELIWALIKKCMIMTKEQNQACINVSYNIQYYTLPVNKGEIQPCLYLSNILNNKNVKVLNLSYKSITKISALGKALRTNKFLYKLDLWVNNIEDDEIKYLAKGIKTSESLAVLDLSENRIGDEGIKYLAEAIMVSKTLCNLDLSGNKIGDEGAEYLSEGIKDSKSLVFLDLRFNSISEASKTLLRSSAPENLKIVF